MTAKKPARTMEFTVQDEDFIRQLSSDIDCYYYQTDESTYNLNKCNSDIRSEMGVFAWVHKETEGYFWVTTRKVWVEEAQTRARDGGNAIGMPCFPRDAQDGDSVCLDARNDYQQTVRVLKLINQVR